MIELEPFPAWCTDHHPDEPAYAFLARNIDALGSVSPANFYSLLGHRGGGISAISTETISHLTRANLSDLIAATPTGEGDVKLVRGERISYGQYTTAQRKWCPQCLGEARYHRFAWDLHCVTCCPKHKRYLADECECGDQVTWRNSHLTIKSCGCELDEMPTKSMTPSALELEFSAYVMGRLGSWPGFSITLLDDLDSNLVIHVIESLGRYFLAPDQRIKDVIERFGRPEVTRAGFGVVSDAPVAYNKLLDAVLTCQQIGDYAKWGLSAAYGEFRQWVTTLPDGSKLKKTLHRGMEIHAAANEVVVSKRAQDGSGKRVVVDRLTINEAAAYCKVSSGRLREIAVRLGYLKGDLGSGQPVELRLETVKEIARIVKRRITSKELAQQLGIDRHAIERLRKAGLIVCFGQEVNLQIRSQGSQVWTSYSADIGERFIADISQYVVERRCRDLSPIPIAAKELRCSVARIIGYLKDGRLQIRMIDQSATGLNQFLLSRSEVRRVDSNDHADGVSLRQAGRVLGFNQATLWQMREAGLIETITHPGSHRIAAKEIERIRSTFIVISEIIDKYPIPKQSIAATHVLKAMGIEPFCRRPEFHQQVYMRADVEAGLRLYRSDNTDVPLEKPLSIKEAQSALHILSASFAAALQASGLLVAKKVGRFRIITPTQLNAFRGAYVTSTELALRSDLGRSHKVVAVLEEFGVAPICTHETHGGILFARAAAEMAIESYKRQTI
jgi:hypothetical protein